MARFLILALNGLVAAGLGQACAGDRHHEKGARNVESHARSIPEGQSPFALALAATDGEGLRFSIRNVSSAPQAYLCDPSLQPSSLLIRGPDGKRHAPRDDRAIKKQNLSPEPEDYRTLAPGATDTVYEAAFERNDDGYALKWGPFAYRGLPPGSYRVRAARRKSSREPRPPSRRGGRTAPVPSTPYP